MPKEHIDEKFNKLLWRFNTIHPVDAELEMKLRIAFQEGFIEGLSYALKKFEPHVKNLEKVTRI